MQRAFLCRIWAAKDKKCFGDSLWNKAGGGGTGSVDWIADLYPF